MNFEVIKTFIENQGITIVAVIIVIAPIIWAIIHFLYKERLEELRAKSNNKNSHSSVNDKQKRLLLFKGSNVRLTQRTRELQKSNKFLQDSSFIKIVALTYKSLGESIQSLSFNKLEEVEICIYSLPILNFLHPSLNHNLINLEMEWLNGIESTIKGFLSTEKCPKLTYCALKLISSPPILTGTFAEKIDAKNDKVNRMRITFISSKKEPETIPIFVLSKFENDSTNNFESNLFEEFKEIFYNVASKAPVTLKFVVKRNGFMLQNTSNFVQKLKEISTHPTIGSQDRLFETNIEVKESKYVNSIVEPYDILTLLKDQCEDNCTSIECSIPEGSILLKRKGVKKLSKQKIKHKHILACFALLEWNQEIVLIDHHKGVWEFDIPGGKVSTNDSSEPDTLTREVFEEIGLILDKNRIENSFVGYKYDPQSAREAHKPVIANYFHYKLNEIEHSYLRSIKFSTKDHPLKFYPLITLIKIKEDINEEKETMCHAPIYILKKLLRS